MIFIIFFIFKSSIILNMEELNKPFKYKGKGFKKFSVYVLKDGKRKLIHFGDKRYEDFTEHKDEKRRQSYLKRAKGIKNKKGELTYKLKYSPNYWSVKLWGG